MNSVSAVAEVMAIVARPDREGEILGAINAAISSSCLRANFAKDLVETSLTIDPASYGATIQFDNVTPTALVTRFRKFKYVKRTAVKSYLDPIGSDKLFANNNIATRDCYYVGGNNITYLLKDLSPTLEIGYYQYPPILDLVTTTDFWLLDLAPYAVIDKAAARIFRSIGDDTSAVAYERSAEEFFKIARRDFEDSIQAGAR